MSRILVVDDDAAVVKFLSTLLRREGYDVLTAPGGAAALEQIGAGPVDVVLTDHTMEPMDGLELLKRIQALQSSIAVILISGYATVDKAIEALRAGAFDYLPKPVKVEDVRQTIRRALEYHNKVKSRERYATEVDARHQLGEIVALSRSMGQTCEMIRRVGPVDTPVLILGEKAAGKSLVAKTIVESGPRGKQPFGAVDCAGLENQEQFERAIQKVLPGSHENGTLLLREVGALHPSLQQLLSQFLAEKKWPDRKGFASSRPFHVRVLATSVDPLETMVEKGSFREELFRRLSVITLRVPPLRERQEDILPLTCRFVRARLPADRPMPVLSAEAEIILRHYPWPGNVGELITVVEVTLVKMEKGNLEAHFLPSRLVRSVDVSAIQAERKAQLEEYRGQILKSFLADKEKQYLQSVLSYVKDDKQEAARRLNMSPDELSRHLSGA